MTAFIPSESTAPVRATSPASRGMAGESRFPLPTAEIERVAEAVLAAAQSSRRDRG